MRFQIALEFRLGTGRPDYDLDHFTCDQDCIGSRQFTRSKGQIEHCGGLPSKAPGRVRPKSRHCCGDDLGILDAYRQAVAQRYRFFYYGDAMLVWPPR